MLGALLVHASDALRSVSTSVEQDDRIRHASMLRGSERRLPDAFEFGKLDFEGEEAASLVVGILFLILLLALLCCCCCRGRRGCSLCDILACVCIYELCCDDGRVGDFELL